MMCTSIIVGIKTEENKLQEISRKITELAIKYEYGLLLGINQIKQSDKDNVGETLVGSNMIFQIHDLPEIFCACDIDEDIRIGSKLGKPSKFFDFVREVMESGYVGMMVILFFQDIKPGKENVRHHMGSFSDFMTLINRWHTWQVAGFEPTREAYFIADETPLLYTFTQFEQVH